MSVLDMTTDEYQTPAAYDLEPTETDDYVYYGWTYESIVENQENHMQRWTIGGIAAGFLGRLYLADPQGGTPNYFSVTFGTATFTLNNFGTAFGWQQFLLTDTASSSQTELSFTFRHDPAYWFLDNVQINAGGQGTTPEPSTLVMFGSGLLGIAGIARRKFLN